MKFQKDIDRLGCSMRYQPVKCNIMQETKKRTNQIKAYYTLEGTVLKNVDFIIFLGVTINHKAVVPVLVLLFVALWFILRGDLYIALC